MKRFVFLIFFFSFSYYSFANDNSSKDSTTMVQLSEKKPLAKIIAFVFLINLNVSDKYDREKPYLWALQTPSMPENFFGGILPQIDFSFKKNNSVFYHSLGLGYQDTKFESNYGLDGTKRSQMNLYNIYYQLDYIFSSQKKFPFYLGLKINEELKSLKSNAGYYDMWGETENVYYKSSLTLLQPSMGVRFLKKRFYTDVGLNLNVLCFNTGNFDYHYAFNSGAGVGITKEIDQSGQYKKIILLYDFFNSIFLKVGYRF